MTTVIKEGIVNACVKFHEEALENTNLLYERRSNKNCLSRLNKIKAEDIKTFQVINKKGRSFVSMRIILNGDCDYKNSIYAGARREDLITIVGEEAV